jgi:phosphatidylglycerophosphate synthase
LSLIIQEFKDSIKTPDTEEKLDLVFYRPLGFVIAKIANLLHIGPSALSIMGLFAGWGAAYLYWQQSDELSLFILASALFLLSGIFDSSDGQLARISGQSSKLGLILDGICDSLVTISIYAAAAAPFIGKYGWGFALFTFIAALFHSNQCAILDFYHREYAYFGYGKTENDTYWNPTVSEAKKNIANSKTWKEKIMNSLRLNWIKQQAMLSTRTDEQRLFMRSIILDLNHPLHGKLKSEYRRLNKPMLTVWRMIGTNAHTIMLITFFYFKRTDLGLFLFDYLFFNIVILIAAQIQKRRDDELFKILKA